MIQCPTCEGKKTVPVTVHETGKPVKTVYLKCLTCNGAGKIDEDEYNAQQEEEDAFWCKCEKDYGATYVGDGESRVCDKHHWRCNHCAKVVQVG